MISINIDPPYNKGDVLYITYKTNPSEIKKIKIIGCQCTIADGNYKSWNTAPTKFPTWTVVDTTIVGIDQKGRKIELQKYYMDLYVITKTFKEIKEFVQSKS